MHKDEIIAVVWRNRGAYAEKHHHDLAAIVDDLQTRQKKKEYRLVDRSDRTKAGGSRPPVRARAQSGIRLRISSTDASLPHSRGPMA